ncbi:hypothetical protein ACF09K_09165 [Streptomyces sp. NPDC014882]|uniref:hypothetical protein n=1 Tax=Streptomyces sp. NPDC014882 TaxID=3364927 RepID=UPI0037010D4A
MADSQSNARLRADAGAPTSGVIHVRTRLTADFTVISNALAQRRGSAVTIGVAAYIASLPDGSPVSIAALCEHFSEGEILISRALRELEAAGHLERRRERTPSGQVRTRTYFYDVPGGAPHPDGPPEPPGPPRPRRKPATATPPAPAAVRQTARPPVPAEPDPQAPLAGFDPPALLAEAEPSTPLPLAEVEPSALLAELDPPAPLAEADPRAVAVLAGLRRVDPRLILSEREVARLAPAVGRWLAAGLLPTHITDHLTAGLPSPLLARPVGILAYRLGETPLPLPARGAEPPVRPAVVPRVDCDGCERPMRTPGHVRCRDCRAEDELRAAG